MFLCKYIIFFIKTSYKFIFLILGGLIKELYEFLKITRIPHDKYIKFDHVLGSNSTQGPQCDGHHTQAQKKHSIWAL
jgi:hypothetical protein